MWYNPKIYTDLGGLTEVDLLWAIYQLLLSATTLFFALVGIYFFVKFLFWLLPHYWSKGKD